MTEGFKSIGDMTWELRAKSEALERIHELLDPEPPKEAGDDARELWVRRRRLPVNALVAMVDTVIRERDEMRAAVVESAARSVVSAGVSQADAASIIDELLRTLPSDRRTFRSLRTRAEGLVDKLRSAPEVDHGP